VISHQVTKAQRNEVVVKIHHPSPLQTIQYLRALV